MSKFDYCGDLYDLNSTNTELYEEHQKWYDEYKASSIGDLLDRMHDMVYSYKKAVDNSSKELVEAQEKLTEAVDDLRLQEEVYDMLKSKMEAQLEKLQDKIDSLEG